jgi:hypothetical protein
MKEEFVIYEQAVYLKELGFDKPCFGYYVPLLDNTQELEIKLIQTNGNKIVIAPLYQQAFSWFREKHKLYSEIRTFAWDYDKELLGFSIRTYLDPLKIETERIVHPEVYKTYEEAEIACLNKLIEIVKTKEV